MTDQDNLENNAPEEESSSSRPVLSPAWYNRLKWFTLIFLPAFSALYFGLGSIWALPATEQVVGTCAVLATFLGALIGISNRNFQKEGADGSINARIEGNTVLLSDLRLPSIAPEELAAKKSVTIQVNPDSQ